jgi:hypothetical protein
MIVNLLLEEFDLFKYERIGIVVAHFPLHHFRYRNYIKIYWKRYFWYTMIDVLSPVRIERGLQPLKQIAFYHGIQNGFYFGFMISWTSFLIPLSIYGAVAFTYGYFDGSKEGHNNELLPITSLVTSIWMMIFFEIWKKREKLLAYNFDVLGISKNEK